MYSGSSFYANRQQGGESGTRQLHSRTWVTEPPPFGAACDRFSPPTGPPRTCSPDHYHVAYRDIVNPPKWTAKGWVGVDDFIKPRRGTAPSLYGSSGLMQPTAPPQHAAGLAPLAPPCANEVRLQELLNLQRRKVNTDPGPGFYEPRDVTVRRRFRRQHDPDLDGPFFPETVPDGATTRSREIAALIRTPGDSGLGPGDYDGLLTKDVVMKSAPTFKVGVVDRQGHAPHVKSLSISRSIQHGIDWHVPIIVQPLPVAASAAESSTGGGTAASTSSSDGAAAAAGTTAAGATSPRPASAGMSRAARPPTIERPMYGSSGGSSSGDLSPSGRGSTATADVAIGLPPAPPSQVSRAVRRQQQRRPGDWDWNRLGENYRTTWTTLHGGAYSNGDHTAPRATPGSPLSSSGPSLAHPPLDQGIYPILEESSGALRNDPSAPQGMTLLMMQNAQFGAQQQQQQQQQAYAPLYSASAAQQQQQQQQPYFVASYSVGPATAGAGGLGGASASNMKTLLSDEDLRRRQQAAQLAAKAQQASSRVSDWQSKFAG
ncbi:hypothetical protein Agub_g7003 [Astrephomene gubernaculifera]|uniref:Uncharacterized protein n=1 Tax=Astrephomene gubernaculifera TaxID=47775 RepID=A0AAD3HM34_9CHLO|nr:hypothetical protein Agub_g7003 [Astrephomene gubernaculifera]